MLGRLILLFASMLKVGLFTFGGGYAMINLLDREFVERRGWLGEEEFTDLVTVAESTPGPIAINCATFIGYRREGFLGAVFATAGMCTPSLVIIYLISLFFNHFLSLGWVASAFNGIQVCVIYLIFSAGLKMLKKMKKRPFNIAVAAVTFALAVSLSLFSVSFSSIFYILLAGLAGLVIYLVGMLRQRGKEGGK